MPGLGPVEILIILVVLVALAGLLGAVVLGALAAARRTDAAPPQQTLEERLRELDDLRARGVLTEQEHAAARSRALGG